VRTAEDFYLPPLQSGLTFNETRIISQRQPGVVWKDRVGYAHEAVLQDYANLAHYQVYASGPSEMVLAAYKLFIRHGLPAEQFYSDML
jgi:CDP-4-dehydro-6-deoxyglucose reductase